ncbi:hypothetical protein LTR17_025749 [Elasticomyces elasticus]|nr:hypothetical protein LTR17_025749 [Elasticomyces elasticus]
MESAILPGSHNFGMTAGHSDLIKFESITSEKFTPIKAALTRMIPMARINARKRTLGQHLLTQKFINQVRQSLEGVDMRHKFRAKVAQRQISSWLTSEPIYQQWLTAGRDAELAQRHLWLRGGPGLGKTNASLAAIQKISETQIREQQMDSAQGRNETFLAFFLCDWSSGCSTAEDVLKNLVTQMINQEESLAQHARWFVPNQQYRGLQNGEGEESNGTSGGKATATVDNLWQCLQDMIDDPVVASVYIIVCNLHCLDSGDSTNALLSRLRENAFTLESLPLADRRARWLVTSRNDKHIRDALAAQGVSIIDLENDLEYGGKVKGARQKHARDAVVQLRKNKAYSSDLAFYVRSSIESVSEDEKWIDVLCLLLEAMPSDSSNLTIQRWLREVGTYNTYKLVDHALDTILRHNEDTILEIEELLRALTVAYEPPTIADLATLTQIDVQRLIGLVQKCSPIIIVGEANELQDKIVFAHPEFRNRLSAFFHGQQEPASPKRRLYHGLMALRCFKYIKSSYRQSQRHESTMEDHMNLQRSSTVTARIIDDTSVLVLTNEDEDLGDGDAHTSANTSSRCHYPVKYLYRHLSESFPDVARELCEDDPDFWGQESELRSQWLREFQDLTTTLTELNTSGMSALHVAAGIGANELVSFLVDRNGEAALFWTNDEGMTALHVAANNNHFDVVDTLIRAGATIEAGEGAAGTALHYAALRGNCSIMAFLIEKGANINAFSREHGPVINAAIRSGAVDAVKQIMDRDVDFNLDYTTCDPPLSLAARIPEASLFKQILDNGREKWLQNSKLLDQALNSASDSGRIEGLRILLQFPHVYTNNTVESSMLTAALARNWAAVNELLDHVIDETTQGTRRDVKLADVFYLAATSREDHVDVLDKIWDFVSPPIAQDIVDFSLYQATVVKKNLTAVWLLETCEASPNATAERPSSLAVEYANFASSPEFYNALNAAASTGNVSLVRSLVNRGAELDDTHGYALQLAASEGHVEVVEVLLEHRALLDREVTSNEELGFFSGTALQAACDSNRERVVQLLLEHGANPNLGGGTLTNPITAATQRAQPEILRHLLKAPGIDVNVTGGEDQSTPLINAASHMSTEYVDMLVQKGADVNAQNLAGDTALILAALKGETSTLELLCEHGADVTYRSPQRGLAIQVAAEGSYPLCAHVLAEKMGGTIDDYREQVKIDPSKERLVAALATLEQRDRMIAELNAVLAETNELLEIAHKDIAQTQGEKQELLSKGALRGETYESFSQQIKAMQIERAEILKQLDTARGENELTNDTVTRIQSLLDDERKTNALLRKRQGWSALQEEKRVAVEKAEEARKAALEMYEIEMQRKEDLHNEIKVLQATIEDMKTGMASVQTAAGVALEASESEKKGKEALQAELELLRTSARETEEILASVQAAAAKTRNEPTTQQSDYFRHEPASAGNEPGNYGLGTAESPVESPRLASPNADGMSPRSPPTSPWPNARSPGSEGGFRTIHGMHRPDGALGGYRTDRGSRRGTRQGSDGLFNVSNTNGSGGAQASSKDSLHSEGRSTTGSAEAVNGEEPGLNGSKDATGTTRRVMYG